MKSMKFITFAAILKAIDYRDTNLAHDTFVGFQLCGEHPDTGCHRLKETPSSRSHEGDHSHDNKETIDRVKSKHRGFRKEQFDEDKHIWAKTLSECKIDDKTGKQYSVGPFYPSTDGSCQELAQELGTTEWWCMERFPHYRFPGDDCRPCDNAKKSGHNDSTGLHESISCENSEFPPRVAQMLYSLGCKTPLKFGTDDWRKAYRQLYTRDYHHAVVALWDPFHERVALFYMPGFPFGTLASVNGFCRVPAAMTAITRQFFGIIVANYFDDYCTIDFANVVHHAQMMLLKIHQLIGWSLDKNKHARANYANPFLGVITDLKQYALGFVIVKIKPERKTKLLAAIAGIKSLCILTASQAGSLRGKLYFSCTTAYGKVGRAALQSFIERQYSNDKHLHPQLLATLDFFEELLSANVC